MNKEYYIVMNDKVIEKGLGSKKEARHFIKQFKAFDRLLKQKRNYKIKSREV
jgi:hypothetical protein